MSEDGHVLVTYGEAMLMLEGLLCLLDWILQESGQNSVSEGKKKNNTHIINCRQAPLDSYHLKKKHTLKTYNSIIIYMHNYL